MKYDKVIFLDNDNTCRSPMAEAIFKSMFQGCKMEYDIISRGLVVLFEEPFNQKAEMILYNHGMQTEKRASEAFEMSEVTDTTLILTMTFQEKLQLIEEYKLEENVYTLKEYINNDDELLDPYGEEIDIYEACYQDMYQAIERVKVRFMEENDTENYFSENIKDNETEDIK